MTWPRDYNHGRDFYRDREMTPDKTNPKDLIGAKKVALTNVPPIAIALEAEAMADGNDKYGPYNWRDNAVRARIYIDACLRHLAHWFEGEERAPDSGCHHLGHARACLGIILDAQATGNLVDDRPFRGDGITTSACFEAAFEAINDRIKAKK